MRNSKAAALGMSLILVFAITVFADDPCKDAGIRRIQILKNNKFQVLVDPGVTEADNVKDPARWRIMRVTPGADKSPPKILKNGIVLEPPIEPDAKDSRYITVSYSGIFESATTYLLYIDKLTFGGCIPKKESFATFSVPIPSEPTMPATTPSLFDVAKAKARADSDIYIAGGLEGVRNDHAAEIKTIDLKFEIPIPVKVFQDGNLLTPYVDLKASSNRKADADSLKIGAYLRSGKIISDKGYFRGLVWDLDGRVEGNKNLKFINGIVANKFALTTETKEFCGGKCTFYFQPTIGLEAGRNIRTPVTQAKGQNIVRPYLGANGVFAVQTKKPLLDSISLQSEYIRRWSMTSEVGVEKDGSNYIPVFAGRGPRDYVQTKIEFGFNDYFGFAIGHEYGRLPPNFKLLDQKFTLGLVFKSLLIKRPE